MKSYDLKIPIGNIELEGILVIPDSPAGLIIFSHGSGSSRFSPRNKYVADYMHQHNLATLMLDLLTEEEDSLYDNRFNIDLLAMRLVHATEHVHRMKIIHNLPIGYFGASTGAASALKAAARMPDIIEAVVSRGGRPDLALDEIPLVKVPVLLIVGSLDVAVIDLNQEAYKHIKSEKEMVTVPGASHLFEEPGKLHRVAELAVFWFDSHLKSRTAMTA